MDTIIKAIIERRSIRRYTDKTVDDDKIKKILTAAMYAPSGGDARPWDYVVIKDQKVLDDIAEKHPYANSLQDADCAIVVCGNLKKEKHKDLWIQDCSAATQNILLASHDLGLGSVWIGLHPKEERVDVVRELIDAPKEIIPFSIVSLGYSAEDKPIPDRYDESCVHYEKW